ncbi:MAG: alkaline phosphatase family protein [Candidatus Omnitrophota bacterium]
MLLKYVDINQGYIFAQNTSYLWAFLAVILGGIFLFLKNFFRFFKRIIWLIFIILLVSIIGGGLAMRKPMNKNKIIVIGVDALDYSIAKDLMAKGVLPNLAFLAEKGNFSPLATTNPSESVVAWSSFATGLNPANHGVFDFVMRHPSDYSLYLTLDEMTNLNGRPIVRLYRKGKTLWNILSKKNIPNYFYFCPDTFPATALSGVMLSGMGTPDILGHTGSFAFYTSKGLSAHDAKSRGRIIPIEVDRNIVNTDLFGPMASLDDSTDSLKVAMKIVVSPKEGKALVSFQGQNISLNINQWSQWRKVYFTAGPFKKINGIIKFYLKSVSPDFELYISPVNFDPENPVFPISYPRDYSKKLAIKIGPYYTQGMPHDTWALSEGRINEEAFLQQMDGIFNERKSILKTELKKFKSGLFFFYFDTLDVAQHMFWRYVDPQSPLYEKKSPYDGVITDYYKKIDAVVGDVLSSVDPQTVVLVISDHGFNEFRESVHLNRWLLENGYLFLNPGVTEGKDFFEGIDWTKTKAYALGFGGIYLNKIGRESQGIVDNRQAQVIKLKIKEGLLKIKDSQGKAAINNVYAQEDIFKGEYSNDAPDLFVGFSKGFRASWQTAVGGVPKVVMEENERKWSGDHLIDPILVPGVIFINRKINSNHPAIVDIAPTLLHLFNSNDKEKMDGRSLI